MYIYVENTDSTIALKIKNIYLFFININKRVHPTSHKLKIWFMVYSSIQMIVKIIIKYIF